MVVPLHKNGTIFGVLDLDSPKINRFEKIADLIEETARAIEKAI